MHTKVEREINLLSIKGIARAVLFIYLKNRRATCHFVLSAELIKEFYEKYH